MSQSKKSNNTLNKLLLAVGLCIMGWFAFNSFVCEAGVPCSYSIRILTGEDKCVVLRDLLSDYKDNQAELSLTWVNEEARNWCPGSPELEHFLSDSKDQNEHKKNHSSVFVEFTE